MAARYTERAYFGTAPMLETVCLGYGELVVMVFICALLEDINLFVGVKEKMPVTTHSPVSPPSFVPPYNGLSPSGVRP